MKAAIEEARLGLSEGGIPIGYGLVKDGKIIGRGHNRRVQKNRPCYTLKWIVWKMQDDLKRKSA